MIVKDINIIGGGPAGLYAAFYAGMRDLNVRIIETQKSLGGKVHFYPEKLIWDVGGIPGIRGAKFIDQMIEQGLTFNPEVITNQKISKFKQTDEGLFVATSESGEQYFSKRIIVATGGGIFNPKKLPLQYNVKFEETNLHHHIYRLKDFKNKNVVIVGGGNSAIDWASDLIGVAKEVHLIHRNDTFKAHEYNARKLKESSVKIHTHTLVKELVPNSAGTSVQSIKVRNSQSDQDYFLELDELLVNIGFDNELNFHHDPSLKFKLKDDYYIEGSSIAQTSVKGVYAIGDILEFEGKVRLIAGAYNDAANAVNQIKLSLDPDAEEKARVSSHNNRFDKKNQEKKD
ncbi:NAD(P)/FAD-dependent oxidoreductase [Marinilactibacillus psychrotolerans]|uniref:NAD(P)/FAD-dependent oxidoreductase n=1 Tax=Marinilactibacillus psychrotolerans TaxID=191770 RepID=UPI0039B04257